MKKFLVNLPLITLFGLASCTVSLTNAGSNGKSSDLVDTNQTASPDVKTDLSIPLIK